MILRQPESMVNPTEPYWSPDNNKDFNAIRDIISSALVQHSGVS